MRAYDNRDMNEMEKWYMAQIEALQNALERSNVTLKRLNQTVDGLRIDLAYAERKLSLVVDSEAI